jgi:hypothetical protein
MLIVSYVQLILAAAGIRFLPVWLISVFVGGPASG